MKIKRRRFPRSLTAAATAALRRPRYRVTETLQHSRPNPVVILNVIVDDRPADYNTTSSQAMRVASTITSIRSLWTSLFVCPKNQYYHHSSPRRDSIVLSALLPLLCYLLVIKNCNVVVVVVAAVVAQIVGVGSDNDQHRRRPAADRPGSW